MQLLWYGAKRLYERVTLRNVCDKLRKAFDASTVSYVVDYIFSDKKVQLTRSWYSFQYLKGWRKPFFFGQVRCCRKGVVAKCHSTARYELKTAIMDKLEAGRAKRTCQDEKLKVIVKCHFIFLYCFCLFLKEVYKTLQANLVTD